MSEETHTTEKVYCYDHPSAYKQDNSAMWAALMSKGNGCENAMMYNQMNNPMWLVWMMAMRWMYGNGDGYGNNAQLAQLQGQVADNQSFNNMLSAITQNQNVMNDIATRTSTSIDFVRESLCNLNAAIQNVAGKTELSAEKVANAVAIGDQNIISQMLQCCCQNKMLVQEMGYKNELANERQTSILGSKIDAFAAQNALGNCQQTNTLERAIENNRQAVVNGFASIGYQMAADKAEILRNNDYQTQRILDQMCANTTQALRDQLADKDRELQTATILAQVKNSCGCSCGCN